MTSHIGQHLLTAVITRLEAERADALATLNLYLGVPVGVGDHPNIVDEIHNAVTRLSTAEETLETVNRHFATPAALATDALEDDE